MDNNGVRPIDPVVSRSFSARGPAASAKLEVYLGTLRRAGRRITEQREVICEYLAATDSHPTPYQVFADISEEHPDISRATVYNTLNVLQELGAIVEIGSGAGHTHYDTDATPHVNLICLRCHKIVDYHGPIAVQDMEDEIAAVSGFQPVAVKVDVLGFCRSCREQKRAEIREQWSAHKHEATEKEKQK